MNEYKFTRLGCGLVPWSRSVQESAGSIKGWRIALKQSKGKRVSANALYRLSQHLSLKWMGSEEIAQVLDRAYTS